MASKSGLLDIFEAPQKFCCIHGLGFECSIDKVRCLTKVFAVCHMGGIFLK